jgi:hypothetical protein
MTRLIHRLLHGHYPDVRPFGLETDSVRVCHRCLVQAYRDDARPWGKGW